MNKEEVAYKLIELYYTNKSIFKTYCISLRNLIEAYKDVLEILKGEELQERINKAIEYATNEMRIVNDDEYYRLLEILRGE